MGYVLQSDYEAALEDNHLTQEVLSSLIWCDHPL